MNSDNTPKLRFPGFTGEWEETRLSETGDIITGNTPSRKDEELWNGDFCWVSAQDMKSKYILDTKEKVTEKGKSQCRIIPQNSVLATCIASIGLNAITKIECATNQQINAIVSKAEYEAEFIYQSIENNTLRLKEMAGQTAVPIINKQQFGNFSIPIPKTLAEQQKIASCLSGIDNLITAQGKKVDALKEKKKGLMQQLFPQPGETTPQLRFPGFVEDWDDKNLSDVFTRLTEKNVENNKNVLTISAQYGLISQLDFFKKSVSASDVTGYYLLHKGDFAYNKSSSQGKPVGAIKPLKLYEKGVVSTLYICFRCKDPNAIEFWEQYFDAGIFDKEIMTIAQEGARNHGLLNVPTNDFFGLSVKMPKPSEQQKIAECLSALDELIASESAKLDSLKDHKKGLMQQLFPQPSK